MGGVELPDPVVLAPDLRDVLGSVVDPRKRRGVRHSLGVVFTVVVCAVVACGFQRMLHMPLMP